MSAKIPLGIFWDIENCAIPHSKLASSVVKQLRDFVAEKHSECGYAKEFACACDVFKLGQTVSERLDRNGVNVVHVNSTAKNAAEDKLQELIDMYIDKYGGTGNAVLCIISSDINLAKQIRNARRKDLDVVLIHGTKCSIDLKNLVTESYVFEEIVAKADDIGKEETNFQKPGVLEVSNLPLNKHFEAIKTRLSKLTDSCGGKTQFIQNGKTLIRFASKEDAQRCLIRINGADVYGNKIDVRLFGEQQMTSGQTNSRFGSHQNLTKNSEKIRNQSNSRTHFAQNDKQKEVLDCKSVLKGLFTKKDDDYKRVVMNLVDNWNDPQIKSDFIIDVQRSLKYGKGEGKHTLFIQAVDAKACRALLSGAKKYIRSSDGLEWKPFSSTSDFLSQKTDTKSFIEGIYTKSGQNVVKLVKKLVEDWNDSEVRPNFIENVERDRRYSGQDGKVALYVTATNSNFSKALVIGAKRHLTVESDIKWHHILPKKNLKPKSEGMGRPPHNSNENVKPKRFNNRNITSLMSVIKGVETRCDENVTKTVRQIIHKWNDTKIKANFVKVVERDRKYSDKNGNVLLFVTATSPEANQALISAAAKYMQSSDLSWTQYQSKSRTKSKDSDLESNLSEMLSQFSSTQDLSICSSLQNLDEIVVNDDYKSVILGLTPRGDQNLTEIVWKIVIDWNDRAVPFNYITSVERLPGFHNTDGKVPLLVTATSPQTCLALVSAAEKHLKAGDGIVWSHFKSDQQIKCEDNPKQEEVLKRINNKENNSELNSINTGMTSLQLEAPQPLPRKSKIVSQSIENDTKEDNSKSKEKNFLKSVFNGVESFFKPSKSSYKPPESEGWVESKMTPVTFSNPRVPFNYFIGDRMKSGLTIHIGGRPNLDANSFTIDFFANTDIAFHFDVRIKPLTVVRNSRVRGEWGREEKDEPNSSFPFNKAFDIMVRIEGKQYVVTVNGLTYCQFAHRIPLESVKGLSISGDLTINWIRFVNN